MPYVTAGFPSREATPDVLDAVAAAGADVIEVGVPFSDPLADGPTIQRSSFVALGAGTTVAWVLETVRSFRERDDTPVVLFTYLNPVLRYGPERFCADAVEAGADGLLLTDLPQGADPDLEATVRSHPLDLIRLVAPTSSLARVREVADAGDGFLYYISRTGVTGARSEVPAELADEVRAVKSVSRLPVGVGFGIAGPEQAAAVAQVADGVVVGSALVRAIEEGGAEAGGAFVASLRRALDGA